MIKFHQSYFESRRFTERECVSLGRFIELLFGDDNDETN
jgi:hypothetical protein